jgi:hypothetical protein
MTNNFTRLIELLEEMQANDMGHLPYHAAKQFHKSADALKDICQALPSYAKNLPHPSRDVNASKRS